MSKKYTGVIPPLITPLDTRDNVDEDALRALVEHCIAGGLHGIFVCGTNGEGVQLREGQRTRAAKIAVEQARGRVPVICGAMDTSTRRVIDNVKALEDVGCPCAAITSVYYARHASQEESIRHFAAISRETTAELIAYNMPSMTGLAFLPATVVRISQIERIVGYKDSGTSYGGFLQVRAETDAAFACLMGVTDHAMSALLMGADGFVPALAPLFPRLFVAAYTAGASGDIVRARRMDALLRETSKILRAAANMTAAAKFAISTLGLCDPRVAAPQEGVSEAEKMCILRQIEQVRQLCAAAQEEWA